MQTVRLLDYQSASEGAPPQEVMAVPSMMSRQEKTFLHNYTRNHYRGEGVIVDAGVFLGASTACFGAALEARPDLEALRSRFGKPIRLYERGISTSTMPRHFQNNNIPGTWREGDDFSDVVRAFTEQWEDLVEYNFGDICETSWDGSPIEILFLDILKNRQIQAHTYQQFYRTLIPGVSLVVQQDYFFDGLPFIKVAQESLSDYFDYIGEVRSMALFRLNKPLPESVFEGSPGADLDLDQQLRLIDQCRDRTEDVHRKFMVDLSRARLLYDKAGGKTARNFFKELKRFYPELTSAKAPPRIKDAHVQTRDYINRL